MTKVLKAVATVLLAGVMLISVAGSVSAASMGVMACWNNGCSSEENTK